MKVCEFLVTIKVRWWVKVYISGVYYFSIIFNTTPDYNKMADFIEKYGMKTAIERRPVSDKTK